MRKILFIILICLISISDSSTYAKDSKGETLPKSIQEMVLKDIGFYDSIEKSFTSQLFVSSPTIGSFLFEHDAELTGKGAKTRLWKDKFLIPNGYLKKSFRTKSEQGKFDWGEYNQMWQGGVKDITPTEKLRPYLRTSQERIIYVTLAKRFLKSIDYTNKWKLNDLDTWSFTFTYFLEPVLPELPRLGPLKGKGTAMLNPATGEFDTVTEKDVGRRYGSSLGDNGDREYTEWLEKQSIPSKPKSLPSAKATSSKLPSEIPDEITMAWLTRDIPDTNYFRERQKTFNFAFEVVWAAINNVFAGKGFWGRSEKIIKADMDNGILVTALKKHIRAGGNFKRQYAILVEGIDKNLTEIKVKCFFYEERYNNWVRDNSSECNDHFIKKVEDELRNIGKDQGQSSILPVRVLPSTTLEDKLEMLGNLPIASDEEFKKFKEGEKSRSTKAMGFFDYLKVGKLRREAAKANNSRNWQEVVNAYQKILAMDPQDWGAFLMLANTYTNMGAPDKGLEYAAKALQKVRYNVLFVIVADSYGKKSNKDRALSWLEKALKGGFTMSIKDFDETFPQYSNDPQYNALLKKYGIISTIRGTTEEGSQGSQSKDADLQKLKTFITDQWKQVIQIPKPKQDWRELVPLAVWGKYDDYSTLYLLGVNRRNLSNDALLSADKFLKKGDLKNAKKYANLAARHYIESNNLFNTAEQVFSGSVAMSAQILEAIYRGSTEASKYGWYLMCGPKCYEVADYVFLMTDFAVDYGLEGVDEAKKDLIVKGFVKVLLNAGGVSKSIENRTTHLIGDSGLYGVMDKSINSPEFQKAFMKVVAESGAYTTQKMAETGAETVIQHSIEFVKSSSNLKPGNK